jgi:outer membrane lipoprotein-sorting protein
MNPMTPQNAKFWISTKDGMPRQASFFGASGQEMMSQQFKNVTLNPQIDPALLSFTVPEGVQVVDMTDGVINMTRQMKQIKPMSPPAAPAAK